MEIQVRSISLEDTNSIVELNQQLGYQLSENQVKTQIEEIMNHPDHLAFVAVLQDQLVGYIHGFRSIQLTSPPFFEIAALVVDEACRGKGIGAQLVSYMERQTVACETIRVRCNVKRNLAHKFYRQLGFQLQKEQKVFAKELI